MLSAEVTHSLSSAGGLSGFRVTQRQTMFTGVDTHAHVFLHQAAMIEGRRYTPTYDATLADYLAMLDDNGISHGVVTPVSIFGTDNAYLLEALRREPSRLRGIVAITPNTSLAELRRLDGIGVVGVRLNVIGLPDPDLGNTEWQKHLRRLAELGWQVEIQAEARRLPDLVAPLLSAGVDIVIDHFGRPDAALGVDDPGFRYLLSVGQTGRVWVKISGAYRNGLHEGERIAAAATRLLLDGFGSGRLMWGSDWPHTCFEHPSAFHRARQALDEWVPSEVDRRAILIGTPRRLFRFDNSTSV